MAIRFIVPVVRINFTVIRCVLLKFIPTDHVDKIETILFNVLLADLRAGIVIWILCVSHNQCHRQDYIVYQAIFIHSFHIPLIVHRCGTGHVHI